jgi:hypothetical protein
MTKQRPSITSTVMVLDPLIYKLGNAIETCTPFLGSSSRRVVNSYLNGLGMVARDPGVGIATFACRCST